MTVSHSSVLKGIGSCMNCCFACKSPCGTPHTYGFCVLVMDRGVTLTLCLMVGQFCSQACWHVHQSVCTDRKAQRVSLQIILVPGECGSCVPRHLPLFAWASFKLDLDWLGRDLFHSPVTWFVPADSWTCLCPALWEWMMVFCVSMRFVCKTDKLIINVLSGAWVCQSAWLKLQHNTNNMFMINNYFLSWFQENLKWFQFCLSIFP